MNEEHNVKYSCGCVHEIENNHGFWQPTGNNQDCNMHRTKYDLH